jgi:rhamnogalacturonan endolyase
MRKLIFVLLICSLPAHAQRLMEKLDRGIVAVYAGQGKVFISWRLLGTDPDKISFNLYRNKIKLTSTKNTNYTDKYIAGAEYFVKTVLNGKETTTGSYLLKDSLPYLSIPLKTPPGYTPNDVSVGDLDGDGQYDIILHQTGRGRDNASAGITDPPIFQAYKLDGTFLWEINLGKNIREGAHYTQFMVYDLDGDGIAEFACKTADGTIDGKGVVIGDSTKDWRDLTPNTPTYGKILHGPEYFTIFSGRTGAALATTDYIPGRGDIGSWGGIGGNGKNDNTGNRVDRFTACVAYLDGIHPSVVMCRGYYGRTVLAAWDWQKEEAGNGKPTSGKSKLTSRWVFDSNNLFDSSGKSFSGMGNHNLSVADVDNDGKDEIIFGSMCVDDNGRGLYTTGLRHGDAIHVGDLDLTHPGLEVFGIHEIEEGTKGPGAAVYDAKTGAILFSGSMDNDVGRGVAENIDPERAGAQMWWSGSKDLYDIKGHVIGEAPRSMNFLIWWDGDLSRELLDGNHIDKYKTGRIFTADSCVSNNGTKSTPALSADILGDWREELILRTADNQSLRIYTTIIPTKYRIPTLMHDPQYRVSIAWQNVGYNQPPHTGFYLGVGMKAIRSSNSLRD